MGIDPVSLAITVALNAASMALTASQKITGPRVTDLSVSVADYGTPLSYFYGLREIMPPCFYAEPIKETKVESKTKGGKYTNYNYAGTWAMVVADHQITSYEKMWFDGHLVYDASTGVHIFKLDGLILTDFIRLYYGTSDQEPDERMLATIEAEEGAGMCPAYLDVAYIFFEDVPLEKIGNHLPQVKVIAKNGEPAFPTTSIVPSIALNSNATPIFSADHSVMQWSDIRAFPLRSAVLTVDNEELEFTSESVLTGGVQVDRGPVETTDSDGEISLTFVGIDGLEENVIGGGPLIFARPQRGARTFLDAHDNLHFLTMSDGNTQYWYKDGTVTHEDSPACCDESVNLGWQPKDWFVYPDNKNIAFGIGHDTPGVGTTSVCQFASINLTTPCLDSTVQASMASIFKTVTGLPPLNGPDDVTALVYGDSIIFVWGGNIYKTPISGAGLETLAGAGTQFTSRVKPAFTNHRSTSKFLWIDDGQVTSQNAICIDLDKFEIVRTIPWSNWNNSPPLTWVYDRNNNAIVTLDTDGKITWRYLDRADPNGVTLSSICTDVATRLGMASSDHEFQALDQIVKGFSWTQGPAKDIIGPLVELHDSDMRPHGFKIEGIKREGAADSPPIETEWMVSSGPGDPLYSVIAASETDLPRRVFVNFADYDNSQLTNGAVAQRTAASVRCKRELTIDITNCALTADEAQSLTDRFLRRHWMGSVTAKNKLTPKELLLEPGDVKDITFDDVELKARLTKMTVSASRIITTEWERDSPAVSVAIPSEGAPMTGHPADVVYAPVDSQTFVLDTPLLSDTADQSAPFAYVAGAPVSAGMWSGTDIWKSLSDAPDSYSIWSGVAYGHAVTWGTASNALPTALSSVMDEASELVVDIAYGELLSVTEEELLNDAELNLAIVGDEIIQFRDAVLQSGNEYVLTGLIRGARGTEQFISTHVPGERFILASSAITKRDVGAGEIGSTDFFKSASTGITHLTGDPLELTFTAAANRPYSPSHIELHRDDITGDWQIAWIRRTRIGGATVNGQDVPLGETSELYRVKILNGATVVRTIESTDEDAVYTAAQQTADWGSPQLALSVEIVQVSPSLSLEGFPADAFA